MSELNNYSGLIKQAENLEGKVGGNIYEEAIKLLNQNKGQRFYDITTDLSHIMKLLIVDASDKKLSNDDLYLIVGSYMTGFKSILENLEILFKAYDRESILYPQKDEVSQKLNHLQKQIDDLNKIVNPEEDIQKIKELKLQEIAENIKYDYKNSFNMKFQ